MPLSSKRYVLLLMACIVVLSAVFVLLLVVPTYLEQRVLPSFFQKMGIDTLALDIRKIGITGIDLGHTAFSDGQTPWLSVDSLQIDYTLPGILQREISGVTISGLQVEAAFKNGRLVFPVFIQRENADSTLDESDLLSLPVVIHKILVRSGQFTIVYNGQKFYFPFSLEINTLAKEDKKSAVDDYSCLLTLWSRGQSLTLEATSSFADNRFAFTYAIDDLRLGAFDDLFGKYLDSSFTGSLAVRGKSLVQVSPLQLLQTETTIDLAGFHAAHKDIRLQNMGDEAGREKTIRLSLAGDKHHLTMKGENILLSAPHKVSLPRFTADIVLSSETLDVQGDLLLEYFLRYPSGESVDYETLVPIQAELSGSYSISDRIWDLRIVSRDSLSITAGSLVTTIQDMDWAITVLKDKNKALVEYSLHFFDLGVAAEMYSVTINKVSLAGQATFAEQISASFDLKIDDLGYIQDAIVLKGNVDFAATVQPPHNEEDSKSTGLIFDGRLLLKDFSFHDSKQGLSMKTINGGMPIQWPISSAVAEGAVRVNDIELEDKKIGSLSVTMRQDAEGFVFAGDYKSKLLDILSAQYSGKAIFLPPNPYSVFMQFHTTAIDQTIAADLGRLHPSLSGYLLDGSFDLAGDVFFSAEKQLVSLAGSLKNGILSSKAKKLRITGINSSVVSPDLLALRTLPKQHFSFDQASFGDFVIADGAIDFQVESSTSFFLEKSGFSWAGGRLFTNALRINPDKKEYDITFFCDRLKLAPLLKQFGAGKAVSDGEVSGRIPITYADGQVIVGEGFLYSTPGEGGIIKMTGTDVLAAGIPKDTPQFAQVDFAMAALKNFSYKWVKLHTSGEGEELVLKMELDGQPAASLPFEYDNKRGMFLRVDPGAGKGISQPIRLDVNFRLPLNRFLEYGSGISDVMERLQ